MIIGLGVQWSVLGLLLFSTFICDILLFCNEIDFATYADYNSPYRIRKTDDEVIAKLEKSSK